MLGAVASPGASSSSPHNNGMLPSASRPFLMATINAPSLTHCGSSTVLETKETLAKEPSRQKAHSIKDPNGTTSTATKQGKWA
eukprot:185187-Pelagomonas_calceolata.AAC.3